jgi:phosphoribosyl 1,2-cyclic phosphate phosphodiesterase
MLVERDGPDGTTSVLIDTTPDMRSQLLKSGTGRLDAVVYTHSHADHVHGIDDLRMIAYNMGTRVQVWADGDTQNALLGRFAYAFVQAAGSTYPPILEMNTIDGPLEIDGAGGVIRLDPFTVGHGAIDSLGFRIADLVYLPDVGEMTDDAWKAVENLDCWVLDALRRSPHPTHAHFERALEWIAQVAPKRAVLTNMHIDMDYAAVDAESPDHVTPAYDGMVIKYSL